MTRLQGAAGFSGRNGALASPRLIDAVAATLAFGALSLCLAVAITMLSAKTGFAMPI
jgi:hypothetical protein